MRLIDADNLIKSLSDWRKNWEESEDSYEKTWTLTAIDFMTSLVDKKKTAYDVEAKVAELEKRADDNDRCADRLSGIESKKKITSWRARAQAFRDAISIVRGKE